MSPNIYNYKLWQISGHWQHYAVSISAAVIVIIIWLVLVFALCTGSVVCLSVFWSKRQARIHVYTIFQVIVIPLLPNTHCYMCRYCSGTFPLCFYGFVYVHRNKHIFYIYIYICLFCQGIKTGIPLCIQCIEHFFLIDLEFIDIYKSQKHLL